MSITIRSAQSVMKTSKCFAAFIIWCGTLRTPCHGPVLSGSDAEDLVECTGDVDEISLGDLDIPGLCSYCQNLFDKDD